MYHNNIYNQKYFNNQKKLQAKMKVIKIVAKICQINKLMVENKINQN